MAGKAEEREYNGKEGQKERLVNEEQIKHSKAVLGTDAVEMLLQVHQDAQWILENLGVGCKQPEILAAFKALEEEGLSVVFEDRVYIMSGLVERCLQSIPGVKDFFVPRNSFFIVVEKNIFALFFHIFKNLSYPLINRADVNTRSFHDAPVLFRGQRINLFWL